jgi:hypothetical protein
MDFLNMQREFTAEELELFKAIDNTGSSISEQNELLSKIKNFFGSFQDRVNINAECIDVSECDDVTDEEYEEITDDGKEHLYTATGQTATTWEDSIFKKIYCDIFMKHLQSELEDDENVLMGSMKDVLRRFNFETLLWIQNALKTRKFANIFEIFNNCEALPAVIEKDRQIYMDSIENIKFAVLTVYICKYRSKIDGMEAADDLKFVHNKYMHFQISKCNSNALSDLYKIIKNLKNEFIQDVKSRFEKYPHDSCSFVVVVKKDMIRFVCREMGRSMMYVHQAGNKELKDIKMTDLPYGKYYRNFLKRTKISIKGKKVFYSKNDVEIDNPPPLTQRLF